MIKIAAITIFVILSIHGNSFAREHAGESMEKAMLRQHRLMAMFAVTESEINESLGKRDAAAVAAGARKILASIPELKSFRPHKNSGDRKLFLKIAAGFEKEMKAVFRRAKNGDLAGARESFTRAQGRCAECHGKFRD